MNEIYFISNKPLFCHFPFNFLCIIWPHKRIKICFPCLETKGITMSRASTTFSSSDFTGEGSCQQGHGSENTGSSYIYWGPLFGPHQFIKGELPDCSES